MVWWWVYARFWYIPTFMKDVHVQYLWWELYCIASCTWGELFSNNLLRTVNMYVYSYSKMPMLNHLIPNKLYITLNLPKNNVLDVIYCTVYVVYSAWVRLVGLCALYCIPISQAGGQVWSGQTGLIHFVDFVQGPIYKIHHHKVNLACLPVKRFTPRYFRFSLKL